MTDKLNSDIVVANLFGEMNSTSLELSFKSHFVCLYMYVCNHVRMLIVQINMFKPKTCAQGPVQFYIIPYPLPLYSKTFIRKGHGGGITYIINWTGPCEHVYIKFCKHIENITIFTRHQPNHFIKTIQRRKIRSFPFYIIK